MPYLIFPNFKGDNCQKALYHNQIQIWPVNSKFHSFFYDQKG
jgi:hypothetical protein